METDDGASSTDDGSMLESSGAPAQPECGDGIVETGESCDDAGPSETCNSDCTPVRCGDGLVNMAGEQCDDGSESGLCNANCTLASCGDGVTNITAGEECDGPGVSATCDEDCTWAECGDGALNAMANEECDGVELAGETCESLGFEVGALSCDGECTYDVSECDLLPQAPVLELSFSQVKRFDFNWAAVPGAEYYQLLESASPGDPFVQVGEDILEEWVSIEVPLHLRWQASYMLRACHAGGCTGSAVVDVMGSLVDAVGYGKASNTGSDERFGYSLALSGDGDTLAVAAIDEDSSANGIGGNQADDSSTDSGAVYVFAHDGMGAWSQQAYFKASNTGSDDRFGYSLALSGDGNTLAVGAYGEDSSATGIGGNQVDNAASLSGAVYVFVRNGGGWSQQAYVKASNTGASDLFGGSVALSGDGNTLAVGAYGEDSSATGIGGNQADDTAADAGAVYLFIRNGMGAWSQQAYVKGSNTDADDRFGASVALGEDGNTLAVGAYQEDSSATGVDGNQANDSASASGAVYVFALDGMGTWSQQAYIKASNTDADDVFGFSVALSGDGNTLAVGSHGEDSIATGIGGNQADDSAALAGAVYMFTRDGIGTWSQQAYIKASNTDVDDYFGRRVALSGDGNTLAVGAHAEDSIATGIGGNQADDSASLAGSVYVFTRDGMGAWSQQAYVKASNTDAIDRFGYSVALSENGNTLAVAATYEDGYATGVGGNQADNTVIDSGAVYLY